eukprot:COSAG01_NODE_5659_length_4114_cov_12.053051_5_plen_78_part_00
MIEKGRKLERHRSSPSKAPKLTSPGSASTGPFHPPVDAGPDDAAAAAATGPPTHTLLKPRSQVTGIPLQFHSCYLRL